MRLISLILILILILLVGCATQTADQMQEADVDQEQVKKLKEVEVREYEGKELDSVGNVRDVSIKGPQDIDIENYRLEITGLVEEPLSLTYEEVLAHQKYSKVVRIFCTMGWDATVLWEGVLVKDLINQAKPTNKANTVIFHAADGYTTSHSLFYINEKDIIMADKINNVTLPDSQGFPFMLVAEDKWGYKWVKWITKIELSDDINYRGYWESRGYSNLGDLDKDKYE